MENDNHNINPFKEIDDDFDVILDETMLKESNEQYYYTCSQCNSLDNSSQGRLISNILLNLIESLENYLLKIARSDYIEGTLDWDFHLVESSFMNAFCMPSGKILVYSGILSIADNEEKIAYIMAHEIAHTLLNHPREHIIVKDKDYNNVLLFKPFSQKEEFEADRLGMMIAHWAEYDISKIPSFAQDLILNDNSFNFFSTHPLNKERIENMKRIVEEINSLEDPFISPIIRNSKSNRMVNSTYVSHGNTYSSSYADKIKCDSCGHYVSSESSFCIHCGAKLNDDYKKPVETEPNNVFRCGRCGARINKGDMFCSHCGNILVDDLKCSSCGAQINPGDVFCINCGKKL